MFFMTSYKKKMNHVKYVLKQSKNPPTKKNHNQNKNTQKRFYFLAYKMFTQNDLRCLYNKL